ncbi:MAG: hypothetical protein MJZ23_05230 [Paludibacteraceae bacterium]|nr:hypothetical protein [Paludibacteraceae bacterium]
MNNQKIYEIIKKLADDIVKDGAPFSRADLAYELKKFGIGNDSAEVAALVWQAYRYFNQDSNIDKAFTSNAGKQSVVEEYRTQALATEGQLEQAFDSAKANANNAANALVDLTKEADYALSADLAQGVASLTQVLSGTSGVVAIKEKTESLVKKYAALVDAYHDAEDSVRISVADFVTLRTCINEVYMKYATTLLDVFGDRIKQVAPEMFNFDQIAFLDVNAMQKNIELEFSKIDDNCATLIGEIKDSFQNSLQKSFSDFKLIGKAQKEIGLVMAGLNMVSHYVDAGMKTTRLQSDLTALKGAVKHDVTLINGDRARLFAIYRTISEVLIPKAQAFYRHADSVMDNELTAIIEGIYSQPEAKALRQERDELIAQCHEMESTIADHQRSIELYSRLIADADSELNIKLPTYNEAKARKPEKPNIFKNMATFGGSAKDYNRAVFEWNAACAPVVNTYEDMQADRLLNEKELASHKEALKAQEEKYAQLKAKLYTINDKLMAILGTNEEAKLALLSHLKPMVALLHLGKDIMESKLDQQLVNTVDIKNHNQTVELPSMIADNLDRLSQQIKQANNSLNGPNTTASDKFEQQMVMGCAMIMDEWLKIGKEELRLRKVGNEYDNELKHLQLHFKNYLKQVDDKGAYLNEVLKHINTAKSNDELRNALLELGEWDANSISEQDWNDFLNGNKPLNI